MEESGDGAFRLPGSRAACSCGMDRVCPRAAIDGAGSQILAKRLRGSLRTVAFSLQKENCALWKYIPRQEADWALVREGMTKGMNLMIVTKEPWEGEEQRSRREGTSVGTVGVGWEKAGVIRDPPCPVSLREGRPPEQAARGLTFVPVDGAQGTGLPAPVNGRLGTVPRSLSGDRPTVLLAAPPGLASWAEAGACGSQGWRPIGQGIGSDGGKS